MNAGFPLASRHTMNPKNDYKKTSTSPASNGFRLASRHTKERRTLQKNYQWRDANGQQTVLNELNFQAGGSPDPF